MITYHGTKDPNNLFKDNMKEKIEAYNKHNKVVNVCFSPIHSINDFIHKEIGYKPEIAANIIDVYPYMVGKPTSKEKKGIVDSFIEIASNNKIRIFPDFPWFSKLQEDDNPLAGYSSDSSSPIQILPIGSNAKLNHQKLMLICENPRVIIGSTALTQGVEDNETLDTMLTIRDSSVFQYFQLANFSSPNGYSGLTTRTVKD